MANGQLQAQALLVAIGPKSAARVRIDETLKAGKPGDEITRDQMTIIAGVDCRKGTRGEAVARTAVKHLLTHGGPYWAWTREAQCWRCLNDAEIVKALGNRRQHIRRQAKITVQSSTIANPANLTAEERLDLSLRQTEGALIVQIADHRFSKRVKALGIVDQLKSLPDLSKLGNGET